MRRKPLHRIHPLALAIMLPAVLAGCAAPQNTPSASVFDDENIESDAITRINSGHNGNVHVTATSFNRRLLLTGEVPSSSARAEIEKLVSGVPRVRAVSDELVVAGITGVTSRTTDSWITSEVRYRMRGNPGFSADQIKVVTENGTVFLMGSVNRKQGAAAAEIASTTSRVQRVVLLFDYLD